MIATGQKYVPHRIPNGAFELQEQSCSFEFKQLSDLFRVARIIQLVDFELDLVEFIVETAGVLPLREIDLSSHLRCGRVGGGGMRDHYAHASTCIDEVKYVVEGAGNAHNMPQRFDAERVRSLLIEGQNLGVVRYEPNVEDSLAIIGQNFSWPLFKGARVRIYVVDILVGDEHFF